VYVCSKVKPNVKMMVECRFDKDVALVGVAAAAETLNERYGDNISPEVCMEAVKKWLVSPPDTKCKNCGYRFSGTKKCSMKLCETLDCETCENFKYSILIEDK